VRRLLRAAVLAMSLVVVGVAAPANASSVSHLLGRPMIWINAQNGKCLGVAGGVMTDGTSIIAWPCNGSRDQQWMIVFSDVWIVVQNVKDTSKCLSVAAKSLVSQARLVIWKCKPTEDNEDQRWDVRDNTDIVSGPWLPAGSHHFVNVNSRLPMGMSNFWPLREQQVVQDGYPLAMDNAWFGFFV
jgi:hypothetical protein